VVQLAQEEILRQFTEDRLTLGYDNRLGCTVHPSGPRAYLMYHSMVISYDGALPVLDTITERCAYMIYPITPQTSPMKPALSLPISQISSPRLRKDSPEQPFEWK
jgi:hypothetical protein